MDLFTILQEMINENIFEIKIGNCRIILNNQDAKYYHFHIYYK